MEAYLQRHNIRTLKGFSGIYVELLNQGTGPRADSGKYVTLKYSISTLDNRTLDSFFRPSRPITYMLQSGYMLKSVDDGLRLLRIGGHAKFYIPSMLAFGGMPPSGTLRPYEDIVFEVHVIDIREAAH